MTDTPHKTAMQSTQKKMRAAVAAAKTKRGIVLYLHGNGKGKTSSALGTLFRALGHGQRAGLVQFIKGRWKTGELSLLKNHPQVSLAIMKTGFTWDTQNREQDEASAQATWQQAKGFLQDPSLQLVVLDEITYMVDFNYLSLTDICHSLQQRPATQNVIITGRSLIPAFAELADTHSEVVEIKHAFNAGIKAQRGIEF